MLNADQWIHYDDNDRTSNGSTKTDEAESTMSMVAQFLEQLHGNMSSSHEKEVITTRLLAIAEARKEARGIIGSHSQAMPLFISILRNGNPLAKKVVKKASLLDRGKIGHFFYSRNSFSPKNKQNILS